MKSKATRRGVAACAATTLAIGVLTVFGTSVADAAPVVRDWADGKTSFNRTISNGTPGVGETITVTTKWRRTDNVTETIAWATDVFPPCLTYVPGSATMNGVPITPTVNPNRGGTPPSGIATINGSWANAPGTNNPTYALQYTVGANCAIGTSLATGMDYSGDRGAGYYGFGGPNFTVGKGNPVTTLAPVTGVRVGQSTTLTATVVGGGSASGNVVEFYNGATKLGQGTLDASGIASYAWTPAVAGAYTLSAKFVGTTVANASQSTPQTVQADVTSSIALAPVSGAKAGIASTLTATVSPAGAGGTVEFRDGAAVIGTGTVAADGTATTSWTPAAGGARTLEAVFSGRTGVLGSTTSQQVTVAAADVASTTTLAPVSGAKVGLATTLTATVSPAAVGGTVTFKDGATVIGAGTVAADGTATTSWTPATEGVRTVSAEFAGHAGVLASATTQDVTVAAADVASTTTLAPVSGAKVGLATTLTATVSPAAVGGTVTFKDGATVIGAGTVAADGTATTSWTPATDGVRTVSAEFAGHAGVLASATTQDVTVAAADVASTTSLAPVSGAKVGVASTLTATVSPAGAGGTVEFRDGSDVVASVPVEADGTATTAWTPTAGGSRTLEAVFSGRTGVLGSTTTQDVTVSAADVASTTTLAPVSGAKVGVASTLTATVSPAGAGGTVEFRDGSDVVASVPVEADGTATTSWTPNAGGSRTLEAVFSGRTGVLGSTTTQDVTVADADVVSSVVLGSVTGAKVGQPTTLTATVSPAAAGGTVTFKDGTTVIGSANVGADGFATMSWTPATDGARTLSAEFSGRAGVLGSTTTQDVTVAAADVVSSVVLGSVTGAKVGQVSTLTATVNPAGAGGTVEFRDGATVIDTVTVGTDGTASASWSPMTGGARTLEAVFSGREGVLGSTTSQSVTVAEADVASTTTLAPVSGAKVGVASTLTATVSPAAAGGTVTFKDGADVIGTGTVGADGTATTSWTPVTDGVRTVSAEFAGHAGVLASATTQDVTVAAADVASTTTLASVSGAKVGVASTLTATVSPAAVGGTVTFKDGADVIGTGTVAADGTATTPWTPATDGVRILSAEFASHAGVLASATTQDVTVAAADVASTTTLAPVSGAKVGVASTLTATVSPAAAGGTVEFRDGTELIASVEVGADGTASTVWSPTAGGARTVHAVFSGRNGVLGSNTSQQVTVEAADVASSVLLGSVTGAKAGVATTLTATVSPAAAGGTVEFKDGATVIGTANVGADGIATTSWTPAAGGTHTLEAVFSGRTGVLGSTTSQQVTVEAADVASTTTLAPVSGAKAGQVTTLTATVSPVAAGGSVEFRDGTTVLATVPVAADGTASTSWTPTSGGARTLEAVFSGRTGVLGSTTSQQVTVDAADVASATILATVSGAKVGQPTTLTATVSPAAAGGTVTFKDGATVIGTGNVGADGRATTTWTPATAGARSLEAEFSGRTGVLGSTTTQQVTVADADVVSSVELAPISGAKVGQITTLKATLSPAAAGGTVTFKEGNTVIGTAIIGADGIATLQWTPTAAGSPVITVEFDGHSTVEAGTDHATVTVAPAGGNGGGFGSLGSLFGGFGS